MRQFFKLGLPLVALVAAGLALYLGGQGEALYSLLLGIGAGVCLCAAAIAAEALLGVVVTCAFGTGVGLYLTLQHTGALSGDICRVDSVFDCAAVNTSEYSELFGVPIALLGAAFYIALGVVAWLGWRAREGYERVPGLVVIAGIGASLYSGFLAWASATLGAWCLFCISLYLVNALLLVAGLVATRGGEPVGAQMRAAVFGGDRSLTTALTAGFVALIGGVLVYRSLGDATADVGEPGEATSDQLGLLYEQPAGPVSLTGREPTLGAADARFTLVEWADYECPYCAETASHLKKIAAANPDLKIIFRHYPLSPQCNPNVGRDMHQFACGAAAAAICADEQGRFWEMNEMMFNNQKYLGPNDIQFMAGQVGLDLAAFTACLERPETRAALDRDVAAGNKAGIFSTPSLYLEGVHPDGWIKMSAGAEGVPYLLEAVRSGQTLPPARPPQE